MFKGWTFKQPSELAKKFGNFVLAMFKCFWQIFAALNYGVGVGGVPAPSLLLQLVDANVPLLYTSDFLFWWCVKIDKSNSFIFCEN